MKENKSQVISKTRKNNSINNGLKRKLADNPDLFDFIIHNVNIRQIKNHFKLNTDEIGNLKVIDSTSLDLFISLYRINDLKRITEFLNESNRILEEGGYFVCRGATLAQRHSKIDNKFSFPLRNIVRQLDFIINRVIPKIDLINDLYFNITKGKNRALSKAEILGRLFYSGFEVINTKEINGVTYIFSKKIKVPSTNSNPTYGPVIKLKRRGKGGKFIDIYKFRTMHSFSEYLHNYLAEKNGYKNNGKLEQDFRKTRWGRFLRKIWLDELPQLINLLKGELSLVGPRAFSEEYLKNYPESHIQKRQKYKPGMIPTYISLNMDEGHKTRIKSEKIYMKMKDKHPILTDIKFFLMAIYNIFTGKVSSD